MAGLKNKVNTNSAEFQSLISNSEDEFVKKYKKLDKNNAANIYSRVSTKIVDMITGVDNLNSFKEYLKHTGYVNNIEDENTLNIFRKSIDSRLSQSNLIILVCKHSREDILEHIFDKNVSVLRNNYFNNQNSSIKPGDKDENNHSAFYYAIRSGKSKLVKLLLDRWPFKVDLEELDETLAESYEELKLKNVKLSDEVIVLVEERLINSRFCSESLNELKKNEISHYDIKERIELIISNIRLLKTEFLDITGLNEKFFVRAKFIVQNLHILKRHMRITYNKLPWEEVEFCLITFIQSQQRGNKTKLSIFNYFSTPTKLFNYLDIFSSLLIDEAKVIQKIPIKLLSNFPSTTRDDSIPDIIKKTPEFKEMYEDYSKLRDTYSLELISKYLSLALFSDTGKQDKVFIFSRTLQVIGQLLKNTWESPNMSKLMNQLLITSVSKDMREIIMNLRDSSCLSYCFYQKQGFETNFMNKSIDNFEKDFDMLHSIISNVLHTTQIQHIVKILETVVSSKSSNDMKKALEIFDSNVNSYWFELQKNCRCRNCFKHLTELFDDFSKSINDKSDTEYSLFCRLKEVSESHLITPFNQFDYKVKLSILKNMRACIDIEDINETNLQKILHYVKKAVEDVSPNDIFENLQKLVSKLFIDYILVYECKMSSSEDYERFIPIINRIFTQLGSGIHDLKWLEELRKILYENKSFKNSYQNNISSIALEEEISPAELDKFYSNKSMMLKRTIISNYEFDRNLTAYRNDKNLQVVIETLLSDVMFILNSWERFTDNDLVLDEAAPLLVGKNLFNYLIHQDAIYDLQLYDLAIAIFFNAKKLTTNVDKSKTIGIEVPNNFSKLSWKFNQDLTNVVNQEAMFKAVKQGDIEKLKKTLTDGAEFHARNLELSRTALHFAAKGSSCKIVDHILDQGVNAGFKDINGVSPLHLAVKYKRTDIVKLLIDKKVINVNVITNYKETPLHIAALNGYKEIVQILLKNNVDTLLRNCGSYAPIHYATINGSKEIVSMLLKKEKSVDDNKLSTKETILHLAAELGHAELVKYLVDLKSNINHKNKYNKVPIYNASLNGHLEVVKILLSNNANINECSTDGFTLLANAVQSESIELVKILLERREKSKIFDPYSDAKAMHVAAACGNIDIIKLLLSYKLPPDTQDSKGMTPLHDAVLKGHLEIVKILIEHNVQVNLRNKDGYTPIITACIYGYEKIVEILLRNGVSCSNVSFPLHIAASHGKEEVIKVLLAHGEDPNRKNILQRTALHFAAEFGHENIVKLLLEKGVGLNTKDREGFTPLIHAASSGHDKIVEMLIKAGAHVNVTSSIRSTALHMSALTGRLKIVNHLINAKAKLNIKDSKHGKTALHLAVENNNLEIVKVLLDHKAAINLKNNEDFSPLGVACRYNYGEMFKMLIQYGADVVSEKTELLNNAVNMGCKNIVKVLLEKNIIKANDVMLSGLPILHHAAMLNHSDVVELLILNKAKVNGLHVGSTALTMAAIQNQLNTIKVLLKYHADPDLHSWFKTGKINSPSAMQAVIEANSLEGLKLMFKHSKLNIDEKMSNESMTNKLTLLHIAVCKQNLDIVKYLVEKGANVNIPTSTGPKSIHLAAHAGYLSIIEYLLSANVDVNSVDHQGWTALHYAVAENLIKIVEYLVKKNVDVNIKSSVGSAALHGAVQLGHIDIIQILLKSGAAYNIKSHQNTEPKQSTLNPKILGLFRSIENLFASVIQNNSIKCKEYLKQGAIVNAVNEDLFTPLHYACSKGFNDIATILLSNNANPNVSSKNGSTPLHYAAKLNSFKIVVNLLSHGAIYNAKTKKGNKPLDLASSKEVVEILSLVESSFNKAENNDTSLVDDLSKIKDSEILKMIFSAQNDEKETIITVGINNNFSKIAKLKHGFVTDSAKFAQKALDLVKEEKYSEALVVYKELYEKHKEFLGPDNPGTLEALMEVGDTHAHLNQFTEALSIFKKICNRQKEIFGIDHKVTLNSRSSIGFILHQLGRYEEALEECKDTYEKQKKILDKYDYSLLSTLGNLAMVMYDLEIYDKSLQMQIELLERFKVLLDDDNHSSILMAKNSIGLTLTKLERYEEALEIFQKAYKLKKKILGADHPDTLKTIYYQIEVLMDQEKFDQALDCCKKLLDTQEKVLGADDLDTLSTKVRLGDIYFQLDKYTDTLKTYTETLKKMKTVLKPDDPTVTALVEKIRGVMGFMKTFGIGPESEFVETNIADAACTENSVKRFIECGFDINSKDENGFSLLHHATSNGNLNVVKFLLKNGADYNLRSKKGNTSLHLAVLKKHTHVVNVLLQHVKETNNKELSSFVNAKTTSSGMTCMHVASKNGSEEIVRLLLKYGAMYNPRDLVDGKEPREMSQNKDIVKLLIILDELFNDLKNDKNALKAKLKKLSSNDFAVIINARNGNNDTLS